MDQSTHIKHTSDQSKRSKLPETMMTTGESELSALGFRGFHRESLKPPTYKDNELNIGAAPRKIPGFMKRKCFWKLSTGWVVLKPKNLIPKNEYSEYTNTNISAGDQEFVTWPTVKYNSTYARKVRNTINQQQDDIDKDKVSLQYSPLYNIWIFHGDTYQGRYMVYRITKTGIWLKRW